jgi:hypothetical protein
MGRFHIRSFLLGIGIGIIITSVASLIYISGRDPFEGLTREQIIKRAEEYGMEKKAGDTAVAGYIPDSEQ